MLNTTIAHYKVTAKLGQGGMGEVYRATDTKLDREVAIKVLPESFAQDKERLARFEREAKVLASLNHPNIAGIYGLEQTGNSHALVLELVEGEDLSQRIKRGALPVEEALDVCKQIAEALEAAHEKGIIHRDLKPGSIKLMADGRVKVLDFGLAKAAIADSSISVSDNSQSPTLTADYTRPGVILGTAAYMSPEQARAKPVDKRSDIWSFGCVLYECLTGKNLFRGEDVTDTLASVIKGEPRWTDLPSGTPLIVQLLIRKCLVKDRKGRLHDISDARVDLETAIADPNWGVESGLLTSGGSGKGISKGVLAVGVVLTGLLAAVLSWFLKPAPFIPDPLAPIHVNQLLRGDNGLQADLGNAFAISPDGRRLVYSLNGVGAKLHLLSLADGVDREIDGTEEGRHPFFSPDGQSVGFSTGKELKTVSLSGGFPRRLVSGLEVGGRGASWGTNGIVYPKSITGNLWRIDSEGGRPESLTKLEPGETTHRWPQWLPDGRHLLFMAGTQNENARDGVAEVVEVASGKRRTLKEGVSFARYAVSGHLLFVQDDSLWAQELDLDEMELKGEPKLVRQGAGVNREGAAQYSVSEEGTLAYLSITGGGLRKFVWVGLDGKTIDANGKHGYFVRPDLSPDDKKVVFRDENAIQMLDLETDNLTILTSGGTTNTAAIWTPDGKSVVFSSRRGTKWGIWRMPIDFSEEAKLLFPEVDYPVYPDSFSTDGNTFYGGALREGTGYDLWVHQLGQSDAEPRFVLETDKAEVWLMASPDGKWFVYGLAADLYLRRQDGSGTPRSLTHDGGRRPRWSSKGDQIFYENQGAIWSIKMTGEDGTMNPGSPEIVVQLPPETIAREWDMSLDEKRFLVMVSVADEADTQRAPGTTSVNIVFNFFTELNKLLAVGKE